MKRLIFCMLLATLFLFTSCTSPAKDASDSLLVEMDTNMEKQEEKDEIEEIEEKENKQENEQESQQNIERTPVLTAYGQLLSDGQLVRIRNKSTERALTMQLSGMVEGSMVQQLGDTKMLDQCWRVHVEGDRIYLENLFVPRWMSVRNKASDEAVIEVSEKGSLSAWIVYEVNGAYQLVSAEEETLCLSLPEDNIRTDNRPQLRPLSEEDIALWTIEPVNLRTEDLPYMLPVTGNVTHSSCPQIMKQGDTYYMIIMFPGISIKTSKDMIHWETVGKVFPNNEPEWCQEEVPGYSIWAPSVYYFGGKYYVYYCISTMGSQNSAIGVAVNETLDHTAPNYRWRDLGMVIRSKTGDDYNCIDPNIFVLENGEVWLTFGSFWTGIYQMEINPETGMLLHDVDSPENTTHHIARRTDNNNAIEAPYIVEREGYYYLFTAFNQMNSSYHNRVGRAENFHGPYYDKSGKEMLKNGGTQTTQGMNEFLMPGHVSIYEEDGQYYMVGEYFRGDWTQGSPSILFISTIEWDEEGWPVTALTPEIESRLGK